MSISWILYCLLQFSSLSYKFQALTLADSSFSAISFPDSFYEPRDPQIAAANYFHSELKYETRQLSFVRISLNNFNFTAIIYYFDGGFKKLKGLV